MKTRRNRPVEITDAPEHRSIPINQIQLRDDTEELTLTGYASTFEPYEMLGGPASGYGWIEQLDRKAFDVTLGGKPDLHLLINHEGTPLARTKSETLKLTVDDRGLKVEAKLDRANPLVQGLESAMNRGDMDQMSFAFRVKGQKWSATDDFPEDENAYRTITEVSLHKGDVSIVNFGANPTTSAALRALADLSDEDLAEVREEINVNLVEKAAETLKTLRESVYTPDDIRALEAASEPLRGIDDLTGTHLTGVTLREGDSLNGLVLTSGTTTPALGTPAVGSLTVWNGLPDTARIGGGFISTPTQADISALEATVRALTERIAVLENNDEARNAPLRDLTPLVEDANRAAAHAGQVAGMAVEGVFETLSEEDGIDLSDALAEMGEVPDGEISLDAVLALL